MARLKRIDLPFCLYHVMSRTNSGEIAFEGKREMGKFLGYLAKYAGIFSFRVHAWCLMPNHFHLLLESTDKEGLSELMRRLLTAYTLYYNKRRSRHGHLFQGRFKSFVVDKLGYLLEVSRYIHLNPVRTQKPVDPEKYAGSSLQFYLKNQGPPWLYMNEILSHFKGNTSLFSDFIKDGINKTDPPLISRRMFVGNDEFSKRFLKRMKNYEHKQKIMSKIPEVDKLVTQLEEKAEEIVRDIALNYGLDPARIKNGSRSRGRIFHARKACMIRIRDNIPWTYRQIANFFNIKSTNGVQKCIKARNR
ncbi:transposase [Candidatus Sumerlaeota bacterium]|nr:transposase [Candidatus Sumerlaeota bacterium]